MPTTYPAERLLYAELAAAVARALPWALDILIWRPGRGSAGEVFDHEYIAAFEMAADVLEKLSLIEPINTEGESVPPHETTMRRLSVDVSAIAPRILIRGAPAAPTIDDLLVTFFHLCAQRDIMPTGCDAIFTPPHAYLSLMKALAGAGYAEAAGDMFSWTEKSAPVMRLRPAA